MTGGSGSAVVRAAGLPIRMWLAAAAPWLFAAVRRLEAADLNYHGAAAALAERIGAELVPNEALSDAERRQLLAARRRLHHGAPLRNDDCRRLEKLAARLGVAGLAAEVACAERLAADVASLHQQAAAALEAEQTRLLAAPWTLLRSSAAGRRVLADPSLAPAADIAERLARGEPWTSKRMRRRSEYLWRIIGRAAAKTTPRGWLGQVALASLAPGDGGGLGLTAVAAVEWTGNVHASRAAAAAEVLARDTRLSLAPLHRPEPAGQLRIWAVDPDGARLRTWRLRRSAALEAVVGGLRAGPVRQGELAERAFGPAGTPQRAAMHAFVGRLAEMGVVQVSAEPERTRQSWRPLDSGALATPPARSGFLDVYRGTAGQAGACPGLQHAIEQLQRLRMLMRADAPRAVSLLGDRLGPRPRPLLEVFDELLGTWPAGPAEPTGSHEHGAWPRAHTAGSGYARLLEMVAARADAVRGGPGAAADITPAMLDAAGAPPQRLTWPVDATVRTLGPGLCVLDSTAPAGVLDARFVEMLEWLQGQAPHAVAYREFLAELDRRSGIRSVELLIPPLVPRAANAIRRPRYVGAWTGDPDPDIYGASWRSGRAGAAEFVPLAALTIQRDGDRILVGADGRPLRVLFHATRIPQGPWRLLAMLLEDSLQRNERACPLRCSLAAFDGTDWLPRITVAGSVVVSVAQWRIGGGELWDPDGPELVKARGLVRLSERRGLPRWVFVSGQPGEKPLPCDLESVRALPLLERAAATGRPGLLIEEMLPAPPGLGVPDRGGEPGDRVAAELMIRLPAAADMPSLAESLARGGDRSEGTEDRRKATEGGDKK